MRKKHHEALFKAYFFTFSFLWLCGLVLLIRLGYRDSFLFLNSYHSSHFDSFVPHITQLGDSLILSSILLLLLVRSNTAFGFTAVISVVLSGLAIIILKRVVFTDWHRPLTVIGEHANIHFITGYVEYRNAFPSGHATSIASGFPFLLLRLKKRRLFMAVIMAFVTAFFCYTRVYLGSHFLGDILAGSLIGSMSAALSFRYIHPLFDRMLDSGALHSIATINRISIIVGIAGLTTGVAVRYLL